MKSAEKEIENVSFIISLCTLLHIIPNLNKLNRIESEFELDLILSILTKLS